MKKLYSPDDGGANGAPPAGTPPPDNSGAPPAGTPPPAQSYFDAISDDVETRDAAKKMFPDIKDFKSLAKTAVHQQRLLGQPKVTLPGKDAKPEEVKAFMVKNFGVPEKPDGYKFEALKIPEGFNANGEEGLKVIREEIKAFAPVFHDANLTEAQSTAVVNAFYEHAQNQILGEKAKADAMATTSRQDLQREWGSDFEARYNRAELALGTLGDAAFVDTIKAAGLHNNAGFIRFLSNAAELMREDRSTDGLSPGGFAAGPRQAQAEIDTLMADAEFYRAYKDVNHPQHTVNQERIRNLYQIKNGERGRQVVTNKK